MEVNELIAVESGLASQLQSAGENVPAQVCIGCQSDLRKSAGGGGGVLLAQERAKEKHRQHLWKSRVNLIKRARQMMQTKNYSESAVNYEKYLKVLELVFQVKKGESLTPEMFKESARTSELTVVASIYWDLLRIYDTSEKYGDRQMIAAKQLAAFIRFTPIYPDIIKRAELFERQAKNPAAVKYFLKNSAEQRPRCFIATSAFESPLAPEVQILRHFRDFTLTQTPGGKYFIAAYEKISPRIAEFLDRHPALRLMTRQVLRVFCFCIR